MKHRLLQTCTLVSLVAGAVGIAAAAADEKNPWSVAIVGGGPAGTSGALSNGATHAVPDLAALDPTLSGAGVAALDGLRYHDAVGARYDAGLELAYDINRHVQVETRLIDEAVSGRTQAFGKLTGATLEAPLLLSARFRDADDLAWQVGSRYRWDKSGNWQPFVGAAVGITRLDPLQAQLVSSDPAIGPLDVDFTRARRVLNESLEIGADLAVADNFGLRFGLGAEHAGAPRGTNDATLAALGVDVGRDADSRWAFPLAINAVFKF